MSVCDFDWMKFQNAQKGKMRAMSGLAYDPPVRLEGARVVAARWITYRETDTIDPVIGPRTPRPGAMPVCRPFAWGGYRDRS